MNEVASMKYAVSDIHGCYDKYIELLEKLDLGEDDTLYVLGDVIDRGEDGFRILLDMAKRDNVVCLMGNHEAMAVEALSGMAHGLENMSADDLEKVSLWFDNGGDISLVDFLGLDNEELRIVWEYMRDLPLYKEVSVNDKDFVLVHGGLEGFSSAKPLSEYQPNELLWCRPQTNTEYYSDKYVVFGHTPTQRFRARSKNTGLTKIFRNNNWADIDCGCVFENGRLGCLCLDNMEEIYV